MSPMSAVRVGADDRAGRLRVLLAVDVDNEEMTAATARLFPDAECIVFSAVQFPVAVMPDTLMTGAAAFPPSVEQLEIAESVAEEATTAAQRDLRAAGETTEVVTALGDAGVAICDEARTSGVDVIVMGRTERGWLSRLVDPSVSDYVVRHAPCPVVIVHSQPVDDR